MTVKHPNPPTPGQHEGASPVRLAWLGVALGLLALPALLVDRQLAAWIATWDKETTLLKIVDVFQYPGSFPVILGSGVLILLMDRCARRKMLRLAAALVTAELVTGVLKAIFSRQRPSDFDPGQGIGSSFPGLFHSLTQDNQGVSLLERSLGGFPSGHVTCAVVAAIGLGWLYPRRRWLFLALPLLVALQRLAFEHHFLSDLCAAGAVGSLATALLLGSSRLVRWFDGFEQKGIMPLD